MTFPTVFRSVPHLESTVGNRAQPKVAVPRSPLLCAPYRAQRWGTGNAMGAFPSLRSRERAWERPIGTPPPSRRGDRRGNSSAHKQTFFYVSAFSGGHDGGRSRWH